MSIVISAHQPNFIPYLGFFDKMLKSDIFVIRDEVLFVKNEFQNRNLIRINSNDNFYSPKSKWLTVPVFDPRDYISYVKIKKNVCINNRLWMDHILRALEISYSSAPFFSDFFPEIKKIFNESDENLMKLNIKIIEFLKSVFQINTEIVMASQLGLKPFQYQKSNATDDLVKICRALSAELYLSGAGGKGYLDCCQFDSVGIGVQFQDYKHPIYKQTFPGFLPNMSSFDSLFCLGRYPG